MTEQVIEKEKTCNRERKVRNGKGRRTKRYRGTGLY